MNMTGISGLNYDHWKRTFFTIWTGQAFSLMGSQLVSFALIWYLTQTTGSATVLATASLVTVLPTVLLGPIAGVLVDRWDRRIAMIAADAAIALGTIGLVALFALDIVQVWHIYLVLFLRSVGQGVHNPAMLASTPLIVPEAQLTRVQGLNQALEGGLAIIAAPLGAFLLGVLPMQGVLAIDILTALMAILPLCFVRIPRPVRKDSGAGIGGAMASVVHDLRGGFAYVFSWTGLAILVSLASIMNLLIHPAFSLFPLFVTEHLGGAVMELGWLNAVLGVGVIVGGVTLSAWGGFKRRIVTSMLGLLMMGLGLLAMGLAPAGAMPLALVAMFVLGFAMPIVNGPVFALIQATVEPEVQGRVTALLISLSAGAAPLGLIIAGPLADSFGTRGWFLVAGVVCLAMCLGGGLLPALMHLDEGREWALRARAANSRL